MRCDPTLIGEMLRRTIFLTLYMSVSDSGLERNSFGIKSTVDLRKI